MPKSIQPVFSSGSFMVSGLAFKSLIHSELVSVRSVRQRSSFILSCVADQLSQRHSLKRLSFLPCMLFTPLSQVSCTYTCGFISGLSVLFFRSMSPFFCQSHAVLLLWLCNIVRSQGAQYLQACCFSPQDCSGCGVFSGFTCILDFFFFLFL